MTRRLAWAILVLVCATLAVAGAGAYLIARSVLLADLDQTIVARACTLPELTGVETPGRRAAPSPDDRFVVQNELGQTLQRPGDQADVGPGVEVTARRFVTLPDGRRLRSLTIKALVPGAGVRTVVYGTPTDRLDWVLARIGGSLVAFGILGGALAAAVAVRLSHATLRPLRTAAEVVGAIDERRLDRRIDVAALPPELVPLGSRLNDMLAVLEQAFDQRQRFMADASHELRTPIAALVTTLEVALRRPRSAAELSDTLRTCLADSRLLQKLVEALLAQVRSETLSHAEPDEELDAAAVLNECADWAAALGRDRQVRVLRSYAAGQRLRTQRGRFRSIVMNLLSNAVEHNRPGGDVEVSCVAGSDAVELRVRDTGPGIAPEHLPHLFEPFYRADSSRHDQDARTGGHHMGLGLSLVQAHVRAMGGTCRVQSQLGVGTTFDVRLPQLPSQTSGSNGHAGTPNA
jgi:signal transduction histidine kinase